MEFLRSHTHERWPLGLRVIRRSLDLGLLALAFWLATQARFDWMVPEERLSQFWVALPFVLLVKYGWMRVTGVTTANWRSTSLADVSALVRALTLGSLVFVVLRVVGSMVSTSGVAGHLTTIPYGILLMDLVTSIILLCGARALRRSVAEAARALPAADDEACRVLLVGAGGGGVAVLNALHHRGDLSMHPVGFLDDDVSKVGMTVRRLPVLGTIADAASVIAEHDIDKVLLTISRPPIDTVRSLTRVCGDLGVELKTIPGLSEIAGGEVNLSQIRAVELEDLLHRDVVTTETEQICALVAGRSVLVTGAGGSIGSELCRQLLGFKPERLVLVERSENALYEVEAELQRQPDLATTLAATVCDITDADRVAAVLAEHSPTVVFHAAAHKHVPMMEANPGEAIKNNALGTQVLVDACVAADVERFVLISTDKAVNPTSVMGSTKRIAERYVIATAQATGRAYSAVRFGNVLGSNGSVVPLFRRQLSEGGPLTVTHPEVKRYFMTIPEAVQLVLQSAVMGTGGDIFVLDMGEQIRIVDLARDLISLSGLKEGADIEITFTGLRPGEKLYEELGLDTEAVSPTTHEKVLRWEGPAELPLGDIRVRFQQLAAGLDQPRAALLALVPEYTGAVEDELIIDLGDTSEPAAHVVS